MRPLRRALSRLTSLFARRRDDPGIEFEHHIALQAAEYERAGMPPGEARRAAILKFGAVESMKESYRDQRSLPFFETILQDLRYAARTLRRDVGFVAIAVLILAIGIGANTAIFSVLSALVLRPLPFHASGRLVWIENEFRNHKDAGLSGITSRSVVLWEWQKLNQSFEQLEAYNAFFGRGSYTISDGSEPERIVGVEVTKNFFPMLGVQPAVGRPFLDEECRPNSPRVVLISHSLWQRRYASDRGIVGRRVTVNDEPATILGVMPAAFDFGSVFAPGTRADLFLPMALETVQNWGNTLAIVGRLKPGVPLAQAQAEFNSINEALFKANPNWRFWTGARLFSLRDSVSGRIQSAILLLTGAVGLVLLIVCLNIANLLLARGSSRQKEISVRAALGAGRGRIVRQLLTESLLLSILGAIAGLALARLATAALTRLPVAVPLLHTVRIDGPALAFLCAITVLTALLFGLAPALAASRLNLTGGLNDATRGSSEAAGKGWFRNALVVAEVALACVLLSGCGLLIRSFLNVLDVDLGFRPERVHVLRVDPTSKYGTREKRLAFLEDLSRRVAQIPGVEASSLTDALPLDRNRSWTIGAKGRVYPDGNWPNAYVRFIFPGYFNTMKIPLRAGRDFTEHDKRDAPLVIIVNETGARTHWPGEDPIGRIVMLGKTEVQVVGIVADVKHSGPEQESGIEMYMPLRQGGSSSVDLVMRSRLDPSALASSIRSVLRPVDPNLALTEIRPLESLVDRAVSPRRFVVWLLGAFALLAVLLASLGVYGVVSYSVSRRTQEIGIRMALGASAREVQLDVLKSTAALALTGAVAGVAAALVAARFIETMLYNVSTRDPLTFLSAPIALTAVGILAAYIPARRASRTDPLSALRTS